MNKTVNINLANILFHIDEKAFVKLQHYLDAIKRSFAGTKGREEIIADIEARIAELFSEKAQNERQVITLQEVDEVINIMGQPEDYMIDEEIFEDAPSSAPPQTARVKKLYRDIDHKYIGGVCAGLEHYMGLDALWIRLIFIFLAVFTGFGFIAYILLWILVPEAATTSQKLDMTGEPVNISNIERKVKEEIDSIGDRIKNADYEKMGDRVRSGGRSFFDALGDIIMFFFKVIGKLIGILLIIVGAATLIGLFIGLFTVGILDVIHIPGLDFFALVNSTMVPLWLLTLLTFFAVGIPFFFLLYLGLKILVNNLKSLGAIPKFALLGLWLLSIIGLTILGIQQAAAHAYTGSATSNEVLPFPVVPDTLRISLQASSMYEDQENVGINGMTITYDEDGNRLLFSDDVRFDIQKSEDSLPRIRIRKDADGSSFSDARARAAEIEYGYRLEDKSLILNNYITTEVAHKVRDQEVRVIVYVPQGTLLRFDSSARGHLGSATRNDRELYRDELVKYLWEMGDNEVLQCMDCPQDPQSEHENGQGHIIIDEKGVDIDIKDQNDTFRMKIDKDGVDIKTDQF